MGVYDRIEAILANDLTRWFSNLVGQWANLTAQQGLVIAAGVLAFCFYISVRQPRRFADGPGMFGGGFVISLLIVAGLAFGFGWALTSMVQDGAGPVPFALGLR
jgi:hypothetical protein